jgi:hypothetical protein
MGEDTRGKESGWRIPGIVDILTSVTHLYRDSWFSLVGHYEWPPLDDPRFDELTVQGWDDIHRILLGYIEAWMKTAHIYALDLEATLTAKAGSVWWREDTIEAVSSFLSLI